MLNSGVSARKMASDLAQAIERGELQVHYQPIVDLTSGVIREVEALARWEHPRLGTVSPSEFIPVAEQCGLILDLGRWVLETASRQVRAWQEELPERTPLTLNVNLSVVQVLQPELVEIVRQTLAETALHPGDLHLEVTESLLLHGGASSLATLSALRKLGVKIAIDDFGTGYSALSYLTWMPATILKLDRSLIRGLGKHDRDAVIVRGVIDIAKGLGLTVIGEGVETAAQYARLRSLGCDLGQGYYFARPLPPGELTPLLRDKSLATATPGPGGGEDPGSGAMRVRQRSILVVDDDVHIRDLTSLVLEMEGYEVATAPHGTAALAQIKRHAPAVILLDMWMPIMDGWAFTQAYRELPMPHAPIVVLTANPSPGACASQVGASAYLVKPFEVDALLATVSDLVALPRHPPEECGTHLTAVGQ
jgi:EAL domain-containing protein (putative c-di-GMP-specific phosphodiesterase class I)/ActR/RegA family two-component response regulator